MIDTDSEIVEAKPGQNVRNRRTEFGLDRGRRRPEEVHVALIELPKPAARGAIRPPHGLYLVALEQPRQSALMVRDDPGERNRQVIPQGQVRLTAGLVLAALQDLENELVALFSILA